MTSTTTIKIKITEEEMNKFLAELYASKNIHKYNKPPIALKSDKTTIEFEVSWDKPEIPFQ